MTKPVCAVVGVGPGNGAATARRFAEAGYAVAVMARTASTVEGVAAGLPDARGYVCDVTRPEQVEAAFSSVRRELGEVDVLVYNAGSGVFGSVDDVTAEQLEEAWRINALGGFLCSREVLPAMKQAESGNIVFIGATASLRGGANFAAFASAKAAQRSLAQSMSRHLGGRGIHVSLVVIDGVIDIPRTRELLPDKSDSFFLQPDDIAEATYQLTRQPRSAWTFELDVRPHGEPW